MTAQERQALAELATGLPGIPGHELSGQLAALLSALVGRELDTALLAILGATQLTVLASVWVLAAYVLSFLLAHNSAYLAGRNIIADRPINITLSSPTSTAVLKFGFKAKVAMASVGIIAPMIRAIVQHFQFTY